MVLTIGSDLMAQSKAMFSQYMFNTFALNPAYAGTHDVTSIVLLYRNQWSGIDGAPVTQTLSAHSPLGNPNSAVGFVLMNDRIGITRETGLNLAYAYKIKFDNATLSMGVQGTYSSVKNEFNRLLLPDNNDGSLSGLAQETYINFGVGLYYHNERLYLGASVPDLVESDLRGRHLFLMAGYVFDLSHELKLKPSILTKVVQGAPLEFDLNATVFWRDKIWLGGSYRSLAGVYFLVGVKPLPQLSIGYGYDLNLTELGAYQNGTNEIMINYRLWFNKSKVITPRYF